MIKWEQFKNLGWKVFYDRKIFIFLLCLFFSAFIWLLIKLSDSYEFTFHVPVKYINVPEKKNIIPLSDTTFTIKVRTSGYNVLRLKSFHFEYPVMVDVGKINARKEDNRFFVASNSFMPQLKEQFNRDITIYEINPDTLFFILQRQASKVVPVRVNLDLSFDSQFRLYDSLVINPDSVTISGYSTLLDSVHELHTEYKKIENVNKSFTLDMRINNPYDNSYVLNVSKQNISVHVPVEKFTEATFRLPVEIINTEENLQLFPDSVYLTCLVAMKDYEQIEQSMFSVVADFKDIQVEKANLAEIKLLSKPEHVKVTKISPETVEFVVFR